MSWIVIFGPDSEKNEDLTVAFAQEGVGSTIVPVDKAADLPRLTGTFVADDILKDVNLIFNHHVNRVERHAVSNDVAQNWADRFTDRFQKLVNQPDVRSQIIGLEFAAQWSIDVSNGSAGVQFSWPSIQAKVLWWIAQQLEDTYETWC